MGQNQCGGLGVGRNYGIAQFSKKLYQFSSKRDKSKYYQEEDVKLKSRGNEKDKFRKFCLDEPKNSSKVLENYLCRNLFFSKDAGSRWVILLKMKSFYLLLVFYNSTHDSRETAWGGVLLQYSKHQKIVLKQFVLYQNCRLRLF